VDYDPIYIYDGMLFNGTKHVDGRASTNPKTSLQTCRFRFEEVKDRGPMIRCPEHRCTVELSI
jgi:hypothetical protein